MHPRTVLLCAALPAFVLQTATAQIQPEAAAILEAASAKLAAARTVQLKAEHNLDPSLRLGHRIDRGPINLTVARPNRFYAFQPAGDETRELAYDGATFCLMHPGPKHHAMESIPSATIEEFADKMDERFGFRPPLAELLASNMKTEMLKNVTSLRLAGSERVGWTRCDHLQFDQPGMTTDLWIGTKDKLPRRMLLTFTDHAARPTWDIRITRWMLNPQVDATLFAKRPSPDSQKLQMLKSH